MFCSVQLVVKGKLACRTTTVLGFAAKTAFARLSCSRVRLLRSIASLPSLGSGHLAQPASQVGWFPMMTTAMSASFASAAASVRSVPIEDVILIAAPARVRMPSSGVTLYGGVPLYQSSATRSASGPMTAIFLTLLESMGRRLAVFLSRTIDSSVTFLASFLWVSQFQGSP